MVKEREKASNPGRSQERRTAVECMWCALLIYTRRRGAPSRGRGRSGVFSAGTSMTKLKFVVSLMTDDNDYQLEQARSAEATAVKLGIEQQILYAENDAVTQSTQLLKMIQVPPEKRPQAIVCEPVGATAMEAV